VMHGQLDTWLKKVNKILVLVLKMCSYFFLYVLFFFFFASFYVILNLIHYINLN
jgi:hypothetical protein